MSDYLFPVSGGKITSLFGRRVAPVPGASSNHLGIDISVPGGTAVKSPWAGIVDTVGYDKTKGNFVIVDHGGGLKSIFEHLSGVSAYEGKKLSQGQILGLSGDTGVSTGPHLHWGTFQDGKATNPLKANNKNITVNSEVNQDSFIVPVLEFLKEKWYIVAGVLVLFAVVK